MNPDDTFLARTDALASSLRINVEDLTAVLDVSRSSLFGWRKGRRAVSNKAWAKLEAAERDAGISFELSEPVPENESKSQPNNLIQMMDDLGLPLEAKAKIASGILESTLMKWRDDLEEFLMNAGAAASILKRAAEVLDGELKEEAVFFAKVVSEGDALATQSVESLYEMATHLCPGVGDYELGPGRDEMVAGEEMGFNKED